ncbi:hypothetical protein Tco_0974276 [Tanacetum coccineum]|uniref:Uncharacterized protein n=1 Tax=Tanacetum coccineum TaxID=301880 RepID=A0ABQ5EB39_9ASTR
MSLIVVLVVAVVVSVISPVVVVVVATLIVVVATLIVVALPLSLVALEVVSPLSFKASLRTSFPWKHSGLHFMKRGLDIQSRLPPTMALSISTGPLDGGAPNPVHRQAYHASPWFKSLLSEYASDAEASAGFSRTSLAVVSRQGRNYRPL